MLLFTSRVLATFLVLAIQPGAMIQNRDLPQHQSFRNHVDWPSLHLNFKSKRSNMGSYEHSNLFSIANPLVAADETRVRYDVFATLETDTIHCNYTQLNGAMYLTRTKLDVGTSTTQCLQSEHHGFPSFNAIISAINAAEPVSVNFMRCSTGKLFKVTVDTSKFALCASSNHGFKMYGRDMDIFVTYRANRVNIVVPTSPDQCTVKVAATSITSIGRSLLTGTLLPIDEKRDLKNALSFSSHDGDDGSCSCKSKPRPCVFVHGLGVKEEVPGLQDSLGYWGNFIEYHAPCCTTIKYAHLNTVNYTWTNATQQQKVCDCALAASNTSTKFTIKDTIVVTHSMGSLMLAGAIAHKRCKLDRSSAWVSTGAPMIGSMASDYAQKICAKKTTLITKKLADYRNDCPVNDAVKSVAYQNGSYSTPELNAAYDAAQEAYRTNVYAAMCSESFSGILSSYQAQFWVIGELAPHKSIKNDGTVEYRSCTKGLNVSNFRDTYKSRFYRTELNHYDMQFRSQDAYWNQAKMPLKWFECLF